WLIGIGKAQYDARGRPTRMFGANLDISALKRAEEALRRSEERLSAALEASRMGIWDWDLQTGELIWSDALHQVFGFHRGEFKGIDCIWPRIHPDDVEHVRQAVESAFHFPREYELEFRIAWPDESVHWISFSGKPFYDASGKPVRISGTGSEITARKRNE